MATLDVLYLLVIAYENMDFTTLECSFAFYEAYEAHNKNKATIKE